MLIFASTPTSSSRELRFEVPLVVGGIIGAGIASSLTMNITAESNRLKQDSKVSNEELKVKSEDLSPNVQSPTPITQYPIPGTLEFYDWDDLEEEAVGVLIFGNSGSAKTSLACWLAGKLTSNKPAQVLALDPHANRNPLWKELGIKVFSDFALIERQLEKLERLLDERRSPEYQPKDDDNLIVFGDELGANIDSFSDPTRMDRTLRRLGGEGRKYDLMFIGMNYSSNADDLGVSGKAKDNYVQILCGATARSFVESKWKQTDPRSEWIKSQAYPCVLTGAVQASIAKHPTHGDYQTFKKKGNPPASIQPINQLPLTISLADDDNQLSLSPEAGKILKWFEKKTDSPNTKFGIRNIQQSRPLGHKSHKAENIRPLIDELIKNSLIEKDSEDNYKLVASR